MSANPGRRGGARGNWVDASGGHPLEVILIPQRDGAIVNFARCLACGVVVENAVEHARSVVVRIPVDHLLNVQRATNFLVTDVDASQVVCLCCGEIVDSDFCDEHAHAHWSGEAT